MKVPGVEATGLVVMRGTEVDSQLDTPEAVRVYDVISEEGTLVNVAIRFFTQAGCSINERSVS